MKTDAAVWTVSKNAVFNVLGAFWQFVLLIIGTRIVIDIIGAESFGLLALVGGVSGYFIYMEVGIAETVIKKVSEARDFKKINRIVSTLFFFSAGVGAALVILVALFAVFGVDLLFSFAPPLMRSATRIFLVIAAGLWILYPLNLFSKVFVALQRFDIYNLLRVVFQTIILLGIIVVLKFSNTAEAAVAAITAGGILWKITAWLFLRKLYPQIKIEWNLFDKEVLKDALRYKSYALLAQSAGHVVNQCGIYIIGILLNPLAIAVYSVANILAIKISEMAGVLGITLFPMVSNFYGAKRTEQIRKVFVFATNLMALGLLPLTAFAWVWAETIIRLWVGEDFLAAVPALRLLALAWFLSAVSMVSGLTTKAINRPDIDAWWATAMAVSNIALGFILIGRYGIMGAAYTTLSCQTVGVCILIYVVGKNVNADMPLLFFSLFKMAVAWILFIPVYFIPMPLPILLLIPAVHTLFFWTVYYFIFMDGENKTYIRNMAGIIFEQLSLMRKSA